GAGRPARRRGRRAQTRDEARDAVLEVFRLLGDDDALVKAFRPKLAAALF
ncbi:MAG: tetratricopeptide repeat protein, partial [Actinobacteria bacterium]|nr:tetratricopeptide repeat protein [Actinomycetota bacterium]